MPCLPPWMRFGVYLMTLDVSKNLRHAHLPLGFEYAKQDYGHPIFCQVCKARRVRGRLLEGLCS